jgi:hypothetical protein
MSALQAFAPLLIVNQGRRAPLRFALAPGCHIPRLWRCLVQVQQASTLIDAEGRLRLHEAA